MSDIRKYINLIESATNAPTVMLIPDIYRDEDELFDETEIVGNFIDDEDLERTFTVKTMSPEKAKELTPPRKDETVWNIFNDYAEEDQKELVQDKIDHWDDGRILVLMNTSVLDGNHQVIASILSGKPFKYIDLDEIS